jgi:hypothetical protein
MNALFTPSESGVQHASPLWCRTRDGNREAYALFRRHYSCENVRPKIRQFVGPGEKMVLISGDGSALFVWRREEFRLDCQRGVNCTVFRNEGRHRSSLLIEEASSVAWERWPAERLFTFVHPAKTAARRGKQNLPGHCFRMAGWAECGTSKRGLVILEKCPS